MVGSYYSRSPLQAGAQSALQLALAIYALAPGLRRGTIRSLARVPAYSFAISFIVIAVSASVAAEITAGALAHEAHAGIVPLREGAAAGAKRFTDGTGRGGSFAAFTEV